MDWRTGDRPGCRLSCRLSLVSIGYLQLLHHHATNAGIMLVSRRTGKAVVGQTSILYTLRCASLRAGRLVGGGVGVLVVVKGGCSYTLFFYSTAHNNMDGVWFTVHVQTLFPLPQLVACAAHRKMNMRTGEKKMGIHHIINSYVTIFAMEQWMSHVWWCESLCDFHSHQHKKRARWHSVRQAKAPNIVG